MLFKETDFELIVSKKVPLDLLETCEGSLTEAADVHFLPSRRRFKTFAFGGALSSIILLCAKVL